MVRSKRSRRVAVSAISSAPRQSPRLMRHRVKPCCARSACSGSPGQQRATGLLGLAIAFRVQVQAGEIAEYPRGSGLPRDGGQGLGREGRLPERLVDLGQGASDHAVGRTQSQRPLEGAARPVRVARGEPRVSQVREQVRVRPGLLRRRLQDGQGLRSLPVASSTLPSSRASLASPGAAARASRSRAAARSRSFASPVRSASRPAARDASTESSPAPAARQGRDRPPCGRAS